MSNIKTLQSLINKMSKIQKDMEDIQSDKAIVSPGGVIIGYKDDLHYNTELASCLEYNQTDEEYSAWVDYMFINACCPLCWGNHKRNNFRCQMPDKEDYNDND